MKSKFLMMAGAVAAMALATSVQAVPIPSGSEIDMSGTVTLNSSDLNSATAATGFSSVTVGGTSSGIFAGLSGDSVSWNPFSWNPVSLPSPSLWTITGGYSFELTSVSVYSQSSTFLNLTGNGTLTAPGYDTTGGSWSFTVSNPTGTPHATLDFTFANSQVSVPDGGMTAMMLGMALCGMALLFTRKAHTV